MKNKSILRWTSYLLLLAGALALACCAFVLVQADVFQAYENRQLEQALKAKLPPAAALPRARQQPPPKAPANGSLIGRLEIPSVHLSTIVLEGDDVRTLRLGAGHIPGSALPGQPGNVGVSAHRDTFFRPLRNIAKNDEITLTTPDGSYQYVVESTAVVGPDDTRVSRCVQPADADPGDLLSLLLRRIGSETLHCPRQKSRVAKSATPLRTATTRKDARVYRWVVVVFASASLSSRRR